MLLMCIYFVFIKYVHILINAVHALYRDSSIVSEFHFIPKTVGIIPVLGQAKQKYAKKCIYIF